MVIKPKVPINCTGKLILENKIASAIIIGPFIKKDIPKSTKAEVQLTL